MSTYRTSLYNKNKTELFCAMDTQELWDKNSKKYLNDETTKYYQKNPIEYFFNNCGFRTPDDFNDKDEGNVFLGDSNTFGIGHHLENTWSCKLNKELDGKFWNLSQGGSGIQAAYRLLGGFKDMLKIKNIYHLALPHPRFEFIYEGNVVKLSPYTIDFLIQTDKIKFDKSPTTIEYWQDGKKISTKVHSFKQFYINMLANEEYVDFIHNGYIYALKGLANELGCNYYYLTGLDIFEEYGGSNDNSFQARDLIHYTVGKQNFVYEQFKKLIKGEKNG